jgi:hypothetical protein
MVDRWWTMAGLALAGFQAWPMHQLDHVEGAVCNVEDLIHKILTHK